MDRLVLIDGSAVAYRSFFAFIHNPLINSRGENTSAVFGFVNSLTKIVNEFKPDYVAVVFDTPAPTFRHKMYPEYKSTRAKTPSELVDQLPWIDQAIEGFNIKVIRIDGYEADDIIGTLSVEAAGKGLEVLLFTGDKDFFQLVTDRVKILHPKDFEILDPQGVKGKFGVPPEKVIDILALMGDTSDNVPGIEGVGPKTAVSLIEEFGDLETVLEQGPLKKKGRLAESLVRYRKEAELSKDLVTIKTDCPIKLDLGEMKLREPNAEALVTLFMRLEFKGLVEKFATQKAKDLFEDEKGRPKALYHTIRDLGELDEILTVIEEKKEVAVDTETSSLDPLEARLVGISLAVEDGAGYYVPIGHEQGSNLPLKKVLERFSRLFESGVRIVGQNIKYDRQVFKNHGVSLENPYFDTMIAAYVLDPGKRSYNLDVLALESFNYRMMPISDLIGSGKKQMSFAKVAIDKATVYSCEDADFTLRLKNLMEPKIKEFKLLPLLRDIEMPLLPVLGDMEETGVKIDVEFLKSLSKEYGKRIHQVERAIYEEVGEEFNINSPQKLGKILFDKLKLASMRRTAKLGARATSVDVLEKLAQVHPVPRMVLEYRQLTKLQSTYIDALPTMVKAGTGRVHTSFNQTGTSTGRLSSSDPNLQNIPVRTEDGREIRKAFIPVSDDYRLLSADYSQIDLRVMAHFSNDKTMIESFKRGEDIHRRTASEVYGVDIKDVTPEQRRAAKTANFAIIYGVSAYGLSQQSELSLTESREFIDVYFERYPGIKKYMEDIKKFAREHGYVATLFDRRRYLPDINAKSTQARQFAERTAINTPIQGTAADMIKIAMIRIADAMKGMKSRMILQVHDELVFDVHKKELKALEPLVKKEMEEAVRLRVPIKVDLAVGDNWLEAK